MVQEQHELNQEKRLDERTPEMQGHASVAYRSIRNPPDDANSANDMLPMPGRAVCTPGGTWSKE